MSSKKYLSLIVLVASLVLACFGNARAESLPAVAPGQQPASDASGSPETTFLPLGDLFKRLIADPKEPRFYLSFRVFKFNSERVHGAVGGYGEIFGLYRHRDTAGGYSWQVNFGGGIHAQFDLDAPSLDLVNTDYTIGFPLSIRKGPESYRITIFHQSSHLGDEFLLRNNIERVELSYEALQAIGSYEWTTWRIYYGGEYIFHQGPTDLEPFAVQGGVEYYGDHPIVGRGRLVGGWDLKYEQEHDWALNSSVKIGLQFDSSKPNGRYIQVLAEGYNGFSPYGQFYATRMTYLGVGVVLGFE
jgi:hypothetical protein